MEIFITFETRSFESYTQDNPEYNIINQRIERKERKTQVLSKRSFVELKFGVHFGEHQNWPRGATFMVTRRTS